MNKAWNLLGWNDQLEAARQEYTKDWTPARIVLEHKHTYRVLDDHGELLATPSGKFRQSGDYPAVGDWVLIDARHEEGKATIHRLLPRKSKFSRKEAGSVTKEQIVAANVDYVFLVMALNQDYNVRRLERYLLAAYDSGALPAIVLSKGDLCEDISEKVPEVEAIAPGVAVHITSAVDRQGVDAILEQLQPGVTAAFLGSSGAGKSTLVNMLYGKEVQLAGDIREADGKGKHTTTHRELVQLPGGGMIIDTPGMRELQLWDQQQDGVSAAFADIEQLGEHCRFRDCTHKNEPGCQVQHAIQVGELDAERLRSYVKLQRELKYLDGKTSVKAQLEQRKQFKQLSKHVKQSKKNR
ncbi:ribosome small subunit-dependent GTPase A [Terribacillus sp. DMT04]|uniref:ribosome small subunit-dependent GTPase A n=1 Tax=Terribacillus sp. DMT04 TaxID=2850441 RepID=UPI001C2CA968|nr:ribosome small subunit-dependent GTPase A [Terribacillus sp. DMT04]QXE01177.1 ribosome small subunit-dependent GTPase A [Terribacillus sp. DMT04]